MAGLTTLLGEAVQNAVTPDTRPVEDPRAARYIRSYLIMRRCVGAIGFTLPLALVLGDRQLGAVPFPRDSLSAYFYSGVRELFVGALAAIAIFLLTYRVAETNAENWLSVFAGLAVVGVAVFPTVPPPGVDPTAVQEQLPSEFWLKVIHYGCALAFILSLAVITVFFGIRDGARRTSGQKLSPTFWRYYHWFLAAVIALAVLWLIANEAADWKYGWRVIEQSVLIGEWVAVAAFALSWFFKGEEWEMLRQRRTRAEATREPAVPSG